MNTSRRDLLKFFGAGTLITPLAGGATAKLIEIPKAEIVKPDFGIATPFYPYHVSSIDVTFVMKDGSRRTFEGDPRPLVFLDSHRPLAPVVGLNVGLAEDFPMSPRGWRVRLSLHSVGRIR